VRALLAQLTPTPGDPAANVRRIAAALADHPGVDIAVFPELYLTGYDLDRVQGLGLDLDGEELRAVASAAAEARTAVAVGFPERVGRGRVANSAAVLTAAGALAGVYRKTHLFGAERDAFVAGDALVLVDLDGPRVAPLICFDIEFPEPARQLARAGADLLVTLSANMEPFYEDHLILGRARAAENRLPHLYVNRAGIERGVRFVGGSRSIAASGAVESESAHDDEELSIVPVGLPEATDERLDYLNLMRPSLPVLERAAAGQGGRIRRLGSRCSNATRGGVSDARSR
jgi:predicted amidohydrolase